MYHSPPTIGEYLLRKLQSYDIEHIFGIPGHRTSEEQQRAINCATTN